ncbi:4'-phosphopantetheinyl transferase family protein [Enterococcus faecalis]
MLYTIVVNISDEIEPERWKSLLNYIEADRRDSIEKFRFYVDKKRSLIAGLLVKAMVNEVYPSQNSEIAFFKNYYGKPYIKGFSNIYFNISHSGDFVCCSISDTEVGVDIEKINTNLDIEFFENIFSDEEWSQVMDKKSNNYDVFFSLWTLKESYVKKIGRGLSKELNSFSIILDKKIKIVDHREEKCNEQFLLRKIGLCHKLAICSEQCNEHVEKEMTIGEFLDTYYY